MWRQIGQQDYETKISDGLENMLDKDFCLYFETRRIISNMPPPSYTLFLDLDVVNRDLLAVAFPSSSVW